MSHIELQQKVPPYSLYISPEQTITSQELLSKNIVLYFYPKDSTPGCTLEGKDFAKLYPEFQKANTAIFGISRDSVKSHDKFKAQCQMPFNLVSDHDESLCKLFDVLWPKNMFGNIVNGIVRSTFLIDAQGILRQEWRKVSVTGHAQAVLEAARKL